MVHFRWPNSSTWPRPWLSSMGRLLSSGKDQLAEADDLEVLGKEAFNASDLSRRVLSSIVARVEGRKGDPVLPVAALARLLPHEDAANELLQLATLECAPYKRELQAAWGRAGVISALAAALKGDGTACAKQRAALALCSVARSSPSNRRKAKTAIEGALYDYMSCGAAEISCTALTLLLEDGICQAGYVLDVLASLSQRSPTDLSLQLRASTVLQALVHAGAIDHHAALRRAGLLLSGQWSELLSRFLVADREGEQVPSNFHEEVQAMFHEEVVRRFEYEAAERVLLLQQSGETCEGHLRAVIRCFVQNLEDYHRRLKAREFAWDAAEQQLVPLNEELRQRLSEEVRRKMEPGLMNALQTAVAGCHSSLRRRRAHLRSECLALLELKTQATREHQDHVASLRREALLSQAVDYLETQPAEVSKTQVQTALHMFRHVECSAPRDAVQSLRWRLDLLSSETISSF
mmetsp:Transcript_15402/g.27539  ORF Transcript_15402/g.27539 Transcript_15402/m.27539 type:complete len:464 (-) Transcript_15402:13-1404(-)